MYKVQSNLKHDGTLYEEGSEVKLTVDEAKTLLRDGIITDMNTKEDDKPTVTTPASSDKVDVADDDLDKMTANQLKVEGKKYKVEGKNKKELIANIKEKMAEDDNL